MRAVLHLHSTLGNPTGIGHYTQQLFRCLQELAPGEVVGSLPESLRALHRKLGCRCGPVGKCGINGAGRPGLLKRAGSFVKHNARRVACRLTHAGFKMYQWLGLNVLPFDVYHEPNFMPMPCNKPTISTIHDLSVLLHPEWHPSDRVQWFESNFRRMQKQCVHYLTVSEAARQEIVTALGVSPSRVSLTYNGVRPWLRPMSADEVRPVLQAMGLPSAYVLYVGTIEPRKNVLTLLRAYCDLPGPLRARYPLVLAGGWGWKADEVADFYETTAKHQGVLRLGYVPEEALGALYNGAKVLAFPSLYEGFGLPPVEMMACGGAVLASTATAVAEVVGGVAELIEPFDVEGWRDALQRVLTQDEYHRRLTRRAMEHARQFTWERCAAQTLHVYRQIAQGNYDCAARHSMLAA